MDTSAIIFCLVYLVLATAAFVWALNELRWLKQERIKLLASQIALEALITQWNHEHPPESRLPQQQEPD